MWVVGTAGHVDHGKSTLVEALTGTHPDRLKEEKLREMTIELGFAWLKLPGGEIVGIVDVPGHRDFIENMLAGVGSIDGVLFIIAADEGIMPQTREHLAILDLLQVKSGIIAMTKVDLAPDEDWLRLVESDIREFCAGTILENAPLVRVSAVTGEGIETLKAELKQMLSGTSERRDLGRPRLSVDRVFTISGYGTVVTGTLIDGCFHVGDEVVVLPEGIKGRIRGIQTYNQKVDEAPPGSRTALNLAGIDRDQVKRGNVIAHPGDYDPSRRLDVSVLLLKDAGFELKHNAEVKLFVGATEVEGRIRILGAPSLLPGTEGFAQIELNLPVVAVKGDRFILRRPSPPATIAGGAILDPAPAGRYRLNDAAVLERLRRSTEHSPKDDVLATVDKLGFAGETAILQSLRTDREATHRLIEALVGEGSLISLQNGANTNDLLLLTRNRFEMLTRKSLDVLGTFHDKNPLRRGVQREEFKARLGLQTGPFNRLVQLWLKEGTILQAGQWLSLPHHAVHYSPAQQKKVDELLARFDASPFSPPSLSEAVQIAGDLLVDSLIESGRLIKVAPDVLFTPSALTKMSDFVREHVSSSVPFTVGEFRDRFQSSRKYALAFLEYLDEIGATRREGEGRVLIRPEMLF